MADVTAFQACEFWLAFGVTEGTFMHTATATSRSTRNRPLCLLFSCRECDCAALF